MKEHKIGIIMNGVTGRMGTNQHLLRSIAAIIKQGGVKISEEQTIMPDPILVGRNSNKLEKLCELSGVKKMTTNFEEALNVKKNINYLYSHITRRRADVLKQALKTRIHI